MGQMTISNTHRETGAAWLEKVQRDAPTFSQKVHDPPSGVEPDIEMIPIETEMNKSEQPLALLTLMHGAGEVSDFERSGAEPFEIARFFAVKCRGHESDGCRLRHRRFGGR